MVHIRISILWLIFDLPNAYRRANRPFVPINVQNSILAMALAMMDGIAEYHLSRGRQSRKRKRELQKGPVQKKRRMVKETTESTMEIAVDETKSSSDVPPLSPTTGTSTVEPPKVQQHLAVGINEVTKRLEYQIRRSRVTVVTTAEDSTFASSGPDLKIILVCRADIDPPLLIDHLPHLVAACNSDQTGNAVKLVPLPKGAESSLAQAIGLRRAAVVGIDVRYSLNYWALI
jgi:ribonuclease P/MRP protein subunit POP3